MIGSEPASYFCTATESPRALTASYHRAAARMTASSWSHGGCGTRRVRRTTMPGDGRSSSTGTLRHGQRRRCRSTSSACRRRDRARSLASPQLAGQRSRSASRWASSSRSAVIASAARTAQQASSGWSGHAPRIGQGVSASWIGASTRSRTAPRDDVRAPREGRVGNKIGFMFMGFESQEAEPDRVTRRLPDAVRHLRLVVSPRPCAGSRDRYRASRRAGKLSGARPVGRASLDRTWRTSPWEARTRGSCSWRWWSRCRPVERRSSRIGPADPADLRMEMSPLGYADPRPSVVHGKATASATSSKVIRASTSGVNSSA